jgi:hypothetical protein
MNPFLAMIEVLRHLCRGNNAVARLSCSPCAGESCGVCGGAGEIALSSLYNDTPEWAAEAPMIVEGITPIGLRDPLLRTVVVPMVQANKILADDEMPSQRRCAEARVALARCAAEDWRRLCMNWVDCVEKGTT